MKDYMFYNAKDNSIICGGVASHEHGKLKAACKNLLQNVNRRITEHYGGEKITDIIAHETYTGIKTRFNFSSDEV